MADYTKRSAMIASKVYRREKLDEILHRIKADEPRDLRDHRTSWSDIGSLERQCSLLDELLKELKIPVHERK